MDGDILHIDSKAPGKAKDSSAGALGALGSLPVHSALVDSRSSARCRSESSCGVRILDCCGRLVLAEVVAHLFLISGDLATVDNGTIEAAEVYAA